MLEVRSIVLSFFQLVLKVFSKLILNIVNKSLGIFEIFLKKNFEIEPWD